MNQLGWNQLDIIIITGDAYVDHPSFGPILIARFLEAKGFKVGIISQPDCKTNSDFLKTVFNIFNFVKIPAPSIEYRSNGDFKFHFLYF